MSPHNKILVGLSGGVDSAVAALLLIEQGFNIEACFMKNWEEDDSDAYCPAAQDFLDAQQICTILDIPLHSVNFSTQYWDTVFEHCLAEFRAGRTPNPDILCNREIKFKVFLDYAQQQGFDKMATGHYAKVGHEEGSYRLYKGVDPGKDQSYFLYTLNQQALSKTLFPIAHLEKTEVRALAKRAGFLNATKKDSTGICFIGERKFKTFLNQYIPAQPGLIETVDGQVIGQHEGLMFYTLGQRQGLKIGGQTHAGQEPWYVLAKDLVRNVLIVGQGVNHPRLFSDHLRVGSLHWIAGVPPQRPPSHTTHAGDVHTDNLHCEAKVRYRQEQVPCTLTFTRDTASEGTVQFDSPQRALTPGQSVVFYQKDLCIGGGIIQ